MADATSLTPPILELSATLFLNRSVEPYSPKGPQNFKIITLYRCTGRLLRAATRQNKSFHFFSIGSVQRDVVHKKNTVPTTRSAIPRCTANLAARMVRVRKRSVCHKNRAHMTSSVTSLTHAQ